jgi:hypothetical protein
LALRLLWRNTLHAYPRRTDGLSHLSFGGGERIQMRQNSGIQRQQFRRGGEFWLALWLAFWRGLFWDGDDRHELHIRLLGLLGLAAPAAIAASAPSPRGGAWRSLAARRCRRRWRGSGWCRPSDLLGNFRRWRFLADGLFRSLWRFSSDSGRGNRGRLFILLRFRLLLALLFL